MLDRIKQKILIIRFSSIGDVILTSPIVRCVKEQLDPELHFLTKSSMRSLLESNPHLDKIHLFKDNFPECIEELKRERFDFVIDLHNNLRSKRFIRALNVKSYSFYKANLEKWLKVNLKWDRLPKKHLVDRYFEGLKELGVDNDGLGLEYHLTNEDITLAKAEVNQEKFITACLGASFGTKRIPKEKWIKWLEASPLPVVLLGGKDVTELSNIIEKIIGKSIINLVGKVKLGTTAALIEMSSLCISGDTATMHMAAAFKTPLFSVWGNTIPEFGMFPYYGNSSAHNIDFEVKDLPCRPCSKLGHDTCPKSHFKCMMEIDDSRLITELHRRINS